MQLVGIKASLADVGPTGIHQFFNSAPGHELGFVDQLLGLQLWCRFSGFHIAVPLQS